MPKRLKQNNKRGFSLIEVLIVATIIGILAAMALPNFNRMRQNAYRDQCITNLRRIAAAKEHWSLETGAADSATPTAADLDPYFKEDIWDEDAESYLTGHKLVCPLDPTSSFGNSYNINDMSTNPTCKKSGTHVLP